MLEKPNVMKIGEILLSSMTTVFYCSIFLVSEITPNHGVTNTKSDQSCNNHNDS